MYWLLPGFLRGLRSALKKPEIQLEDLTQAGLGEGAQEVAT